MSLLRDVLKRNQQAAPQPGPSGSSFILPASSKRSVKSYASSIKSSGGATIRSLAESMMSFYSMMTSGGTRVPKRRRPDFSTLGVPQWYAEDPPPPPLMPGTAPASPAPVYTRGTGGVLHARNEGEKPWLGLVMYSHTRPEFAMPMYHTRAKITGEVRMILEKSISLGSIDVWVTVKSDSVLDIFKPAMLAMKVTVWNRAMGNPRSMTTSTPGGPPFKGKFPKGTFVFPFEFPALPEDTLVKHPEETKRRNLARVPLPPSYFLSRVTGFSGNIKYIAGINIVREGLGAFDEEFDMELQYLPLFKPLPRVKTPFPYIPTREDWPFKREVIGGWTLTPFGGRGRLGEEMVEIEGILGVQEPAVYTAGQTIEFSLLLWSSNPLALEALGQPGAVDVGFFKSDMFALNVMTPRTSSRKNRYLDRLSTGRMWLTDDGRPADDAPIPEIKLVTLPELSPPGTGPAALTASPGSSYRVKGAPSSRMQEVWVEGDEQGDEKVSPASSSRVAGEAANVDVDVDAALAHLRSDDVSTDAASVTETLANPQRPPSYAGDIDAALAELHLDNESTYAASADETLADTERAPSPTPSMEDVDMENVDMEDPPATDHFVRLDGEVRVPACSHPSFRYTHMGREYVVHLVITHPQYSHISPNATGLLAEFPVWYVIDRFAHLPPAATRAKVQTIADLAALPVSGPAIPVGPNAVRAPLRVGEVTEEMRPTAKFTRYYAF
ncbi:hypothetical protein C8R44DRAFT_864772 [Mycena epipterygia]|nr:hypothetical protein C8R44DRAFT_864772 [Mycena epipterygia]